MGGKKTMKPNWSWEQMTLSTVLDQDFPAWEFIWEGKLDVQWISSGPKNRGWRREAGMQMAESDAGKKCFGTPKMGRAFSLCTGHLQESGWTKELNYLLKPIIDRWWSPHGVQAAVALCQCVHSFTAVRTSLVSATSGSCSWMCCSCLVALVTLWHKS